MTQPTILKDPDIDGVTRIASDPTLPRPHIGIFGAIHGNERCGLDVLERLLERVRGGELAPSAGTWVLVHGNPSATEATRRYSRGGDDLNRLFDYAFVDELPVERWSPEHERALALRPIFDELDVLLDLHSATWPTPPFAIINDIPRSAQLARRVGFDYVTEGWGRPGMLMEKVTIGAMKARARPALSVECGQHDDPATVEAAWSCTLRFLAACEVLEGEAPEGDPRFLEIVDIVSRPSESFRFVREIRGLERLQAGEILAADRIAELRVREPCYVLMPNDGVPVGRDMAFLARERQPDR